MKILLVDDEVELAQVFDVALRGAGYEVKLASNGKGALDAAKAEPFDLIMLDQMMPDMSGNEVLKALKADPATAQMKVAMLTNFGHDTMVKEALFAGAVDYILKYQVSGDDIVAKVKSLIG